MNIRVCHLTTVHSIYDVRIFHKECLSLAAHGFDVTIIGFGDRYFEKATDGITQISLHVPIKNRLQRMLKRNYFIYKKAITVDASVYHFHDPELLPVALKLKNQGKKVIFDSHEFYGEQIKEKSYIPRFLRNIISYLYLRFESYVCRRIEAVVQVCTLNEEDYFRSRAKRTVFIKNVPKLEKNLDIVNISFKERHKVLHIGTLSSDRGVTHLIKAVAKTKNRLILCGNFTTETYKNNIVNLPEFSFVDYYGYVDFNQSIKFLNECFVGVSTLLNVGQYPKLDTFPTKVYIYMQFGLPVIISDTPFARRMNEQYSFGICVNPMDIQAIANSIIYLYDNPSIAKEMGKNGQKLVLNKLNWGNEEKNLIELYNNIARS